MALSKTSPYKEAIDHSDNMTDILRANFWVQECHPAAKCFPGQNNQNVVFYQLKQKGAFKLLPKEEWWESIDVLHLQRNAPHDVDNFRPKK